MEKSVLFLCSLNETQPKATISTASKRIGIVSAHCSVVIAE